MYKLKLSPDSTGFTVLDGNTNVAIQLDGGDPRVRADQLGAASLVTGQWTLGPEDYDTLRAFYRTGTFFGSMPFLIDLVGVDGSELTTYVARFVPGTFKLLSQSGLTYIQGASMWVTPTISTVACPAFADNAKLSAFVPPPGQKVAWAQPTAVTNSGVTDTGTASGTICGGSCRMDDSRPLATHVNGVEWSIFALLTALPVGAVIQGIYPVFRGSATQITDNQRIGYGTGTSLGGFDGAVGTPFPDTNVGSFDNEEFIGVTIGTTLTGAKIIMFCDNSLFVSPTQPDLIACSFVAMAVCYV